MNLRHKEKERKLMPRTEKVDLKQELSQQAANLQTPPEENVKLKRNMSIPDMVKALTPELKRHYHQRLHQSGLHVLPLVH